MCSIELHNENCFDFLPKIESKTVDLILKLIRKHSNEGDLVLDCFFGSGTTAVASINENRNFIGCELSEEYYQKALLRINKSVKCFQSVYNNDRKVYAA